MNFINVDKIADDDRSSPDTKELWRDGTYLTDFYKNAQLRSVTFENATLLIRLMSLQYDEPRIKRGTYYSLEFKDVTILKVEQEGWNIDDDLDITSVPEKDLGESCLDDMSNLREVRVIDENTMYIRVATSIALTFTCTSVELKGL